MTLRSRRKVPSTPPSLVRFAANAASVITGSLTSSPTSDHVPALMKTEPGCRNGTRGNRRAGVVRRDRDDLGVAEPRLLRDARR